MTILRTGPSVGSALKDYASGHRALRDLLRAPESPSLGGRAPSTSCSRTRWSRSSWPTALGFDYVWEVEHHFLEEYSHSSAPEVFLAAAAAAHRAHPARSRHRAAPAGRQPPRARGRARRDARPDLRRPASTSAPASRSSEAELGGFLRRPRAEARAVGGRARRDHAHVRRGAVRRLGRRVPPDAAAQRRARSRCRSRTRRCGSRAAAARRSSSRRRKGIGALSFSFVEPEDAGKWVRRVLRADRVRGVRARPASPSTRTSRSCCR